MVEASNVRALISKIRGKKRPRVHWMTAMSFVAVAGWSSFAYNAKTAAEDQRKLYHVLAEFTASHVQLVGERDEARTYLSAARDALTKLGTQLDDVTTERDNLKVHFATAREEMRLLQESRDSQLQQTGKVSTWPLRATNAPLSQARKHTPR